jgi:hypothetical protein
MIQPSRVQFAAIGCVLAIHVFDIRICFEFKDSNFGFNMTRSK